MNKLLSSEKKKVIITNQVAEVNKYLRHIVKGENKGFYNFDVVTLSQIAKEVLLAYLSLYDYTHMSSIIEPGMQAVRMMRVLRNGNFTFISKKTADIHTSVEILRILNEIRMNDPSDFFYNTDDTRVSELRKILSEYEEQLVKNNELDDVMLFKAAIDCLAKLNNLDIIMPTMINAEFINMYYGKMTSLECRFVSDLMKKLGKNNESIRDGFARSSVNASGSVSFVKAYGVYNEAQFVKNQILESNCSLGQVTIIYPTPEYERNLMAILDEAGIAYTFPRGFEGSSTSYVQLMLNLIDFAKGDFDCRLLEQVVDNTAFVLKDKRKKYRSFVNARVGFKRSRYIDYINSYNKESEDDDFVDFISLLVNCFDPVKSCSQIFDGLVKIVNEYTDTRDIYKICLKQEFKGESRILSMVISDSFEESLDIISDYLTKLKCKTSERPDAVSILPFGRDTFIDREHLFIMGLSNENIAGTMVESPVLCDEDLIKCASSEVKIQMEANKRKLEAFERMYQNMAAKTITYSYSYYDTVSLLSCSPALIYLEKLEQAGLQKSDIKTVKYDIDTSARALNPTSIDGIVIDAEENDKSYKKEVQIPWSFSASSLQELLKCPMEYYYAHILHVPAIEHVNRNADAWLAPHKKGDIFHHTMERYVNEAVIEKGSLTFENDIFEKIFEEEINNAIKENPVHSQVNFEEEREEARAVLQKYIDCLLYELSSNGKKVIGCEVGFADVPYKDSNFELVFRGSVDRMDGHVDENGTLILDIIDYKTGTSKHKKEEIDTGVQIQHYVYPIAMLDWSNKNKSELEKRFETKINAVEIGSVKYHFPYDEDNGEIDVTEEIEKTNARLPRGITDILTVIIGLAQQGKEDEALSFAATASAGVKSDDKDHCKYCNYTKVCRC